MTLKKDSKTNAERKRLKNSFTIQRVGIIETGPKGRIRCNEVIQT